MPLVLVFHSLRMVNDPKLSGKFLKLVDELPAYTAAMLTAPSNPDAILTPEDIEVKVRKNDSFDRNSKDVEVYIWASDFPERKCDLSSRCNALRHWVRGCFEGKSVCGFVYILLAPAAFCEFST